MYKRFYNLQKNPFEITPDPSFLYTTKQHNEALAGLYYGVKQRKGFVVLTGEVGTGKTLLVSCLLQLFSQAQFAYSYVFNPRLTPMEFLQYIVGDFGLSTTGKSKSELLLDLSTFLIGRYRKGLTTVLVADEAHHLSADVLEEIRLLTNLETPQEKLLQILLIGQPELDEKLDTNELRQLKQRIVLRSHLYPLDLDETCGYVYRRLELGGHTNPSQLFPIDTIVELHRQSRGFPRLINILCENALIQGYGQEIPSISPKIVGEIALDLHLVPEDTPSAESSKHGKRSTNVERTARTLLD